MLTSREAQVVGAIAGGYRFMEIAREASIGIHSAGTYRRRAAGKLGVKSRGDLVCAVLEAWWVLPRAKATPRPRDVGGLRRSAPRTLKLPPSGPFSGAR